MACASKQIYEYIHTTTGRNLFLATCSRRDDIFHESLTYSIITGMLHSFYDQPAITSSVFQIWYRHGERHRLNNSPAVVFRNGDQHWFLNGKLHRMGDPAVILANGDQHWFQYNVQHRIDGPAMVLANGDQHWFLNGKLHRMGKPARIYASGLIEYWLNGKCCKVCGPAAVDLNGRIEYWLKDEKHRKPTRL